jgi:hypothetical protein
MTSIADIRGWIAEGKQQKAAYLIVVCDTFDHEDYPVFVKNEKDFYKSYDSHNGTNMQRIMEVYDLRKPTEPKLLGNKRVFDMPPRPTAKLP